MQHLTNFDDWLMGCLCVDPENAIYQNVRSYTTMGLEVGSLVIPGYQAIKIYFKTNEIIEQLEVILKLYTNSAGYLELSKDGLGVISNALNEVCNGIELWEFDTRICISREKTKTILENLNSIYKENQKLESE